MNSDLPQKILEYIKKNQQATVKEMVDYFEVSKQALYRHLPKMIKTGELEKIGKAPKVFYIIGRKKASLESFKVKDEIKSIINEKFLTISPTGEKLYGWSGFVFWCKKTNNDPLQASDDYVKTLKKYDHYKKDGFIDGMEKFRNTFPDDLFLDEVYYLDFYSIERFGKTKLGQLLLYGKQSGNKKIIKEIIQETKHKILELVDKRRINAVGFIPWTVKREIQFMREFENGLMVSLPRIKIEKVRTDVIVPQKTLAKLLDRIENASQTMVVTEKNSYEKILLIDDAVGSGATLNEVARQIKKKGIAKKVIGLAITGSFKGFDIISEV